eukprot:TRINITY_DN40088_c0_g1_i1.p3 TRINITY_DN40088_c0_g1~~TRINITY_DN40088_c0_g1_i1.p3  ORF type:complete len:114 (+),score=38.68 TRINITY_DN40088_c0_g1_i1:280-621(+)
MQFFQDEGSYNLQFEHTLQEGPMAGNAYGINAAQMCGFPTEIVKEAQEMGVIFATKKVAMQMSDETRHRKAALVLAQRIMDIVLSSQSNPEMTNMLQELKETSFEQQQKDPDE